MVNPLLAHMGGIDEIGVFLIPALLAIYALRRAERQARKRAAAEASPNEDGAAAVEGGSSVSIDDGTGTQVPPPV